jgi:vesicle coat complex subunit
MVRDGASGRLTDAESLAALPYLRSHPRAEVRRAYALELGSHHDPGLFSPLVAALADSDPLVRGDAAYALAESFPRDRGRSPPLLPLITDPNPYPRRASAVALGGLYNEDDGPKNQPLIDRLLTLMDDPEAAVRMAADSALKSLPLSPTDAGRWAELLAKHRVP